MSNVDSRSFLFTGSKSLWFHHRRFNSLDHEFTHGFSWVRVTQYLGFYALCFVDHCLWFCPNCYFGHYFICSSFYDSCLTLWCLQTFLVHLFVPFLPIVVLSVCLSVCLSGIYTVMITSLVSYFLRCMSMNFTKCRIRNKYILL